MGQTNVWTGATELPAQWKFPMSSGSGVVWISSSVSIARAPARGRDEEFGGPAWGGAWAPRLPAGRGRGTGERQAGGRNWEAGGSLGLAAAAAHVGDVCKWGRSQVLTRDAAPHLEGFGAAPGTYP